jgi:hypothetical protein
LLNIAEDKLNDDAFVEVVFSKAYELACPGQDCTEAGMVPELPSVAKSANSEETATLPRRKLSPPNYLHCRYQIQKRLHRR